MPRPMLGGSPPTMVSLVNVCCRKWEREAVLELQGGMQETEAACM